jgi:hypothetical protein
MHGALLYFRQRNNGRYTRFYPLFLYSFLHGHYTCGYVYRAQNFSGILLWLAGVCPISALIWYKYIWMHGKIYESISSTFCRTLRKH